MRDPALNLTRSYLNKTSICTDRSFTYGKALRPSTPIRDVIGNFYGEVSEHLM